MNTKPEPISAPTRATVSTLFQEMYSRISPYRSESVSESSLLEDELELLQKQFERTPKIRNLKDKITAVKQKEKRIAKNMRNKIDKLRNRYYAHGLTPEIVAEIKKFTEEFNKTVLS